MNRTYDIIVFGASSFIGKTTARYLARTHGELRIALAGRSQAKLDALELGLDTIVADATSRDDMDRLARSAKVVVSTVGPYTRYGEGLVAACAEHGTHYADLTGEALFVRRSIDANHKAAQHSGARIVHSCGFDSVPSDMGMFFLAQQSPTPFEAVTMSVDRLKGGVSGGTIDSVRTMFAEAKRTSGGIELLDNPYSLCPQPEAEADIGKQSDSAAVFDATLGQWTGPFVMSSYNTRVVRRTNSLLGHAYGTRLAYREVIPTGRGPAGCLRAYGLLAALGAGMLALMTPWLRGPLSRIIPAPGEGPKDIDAGGFTITHHGRGTDGSQHTTRVRAEGDPGYKTTAMMLAEAAVVLATQPDGLPDAAGVLTPVTALGQPYLAALREHGMEFTVLGDTQNTQNT